MNPILRALIGLTVTSFLFLAVGYGITHLFTSSVPPPASTVTAATEPEPSVSAAVLAVDVRTLAARVDTGFKSASAAIGEVRDEVDTMRGQIGALRETIEHRTAALPQPPTPAPGPVRATSEPLTPSLPMPPQRRVKRAPAGATAPQPQPPVITVAFPVPDPVAEAEAQRRLAAEAAERRRIAWQADVLARGSGQ